MALFGRKNKNATNAGDPNGTLAANALAELQSSAQNGTTGVASNSTVPNGTFSGDAFSTEDEDALYQKATTRKGRFGGRGGRGGRSGGSKKPARASRGLKGGAVVGLNIGNETIKAVELRGKGTDVAVTAVGSVPTPPDCLSNGVILNPVSLASALRDLWAQSGIKSRNVITSVSGSGALVVRVLEVARMSDTELGEHMNTDLERYVPFPPNDVVKDFRPLRDLPSDPDAPNMEVLLAAAQSEVIDQHLEVLKDAKVEPQAIDVEPLAAARAIFYDKANNGNGSESNVDYGAATAVVNIGATNTEISVLRGDILVFTRSVPVGGQAMTQALCDTLGMAWPDAEQTKVEMGDALPPHEENNASSQDDTDWSAFGDDTVDDTASVSTSGANDQFSADFFNNGPNETNEPTGSDPQVQQRQKQDGGEEEKEGRLPDFDLSRFNFSEEEGIVDEEIPTSPVEASEEGEAKPKGFVPKPVSVADVAAAISTMSSGQPVTVTPDVIAPAASASGAASGAASSAPVSNAAWQSGVDEAALPSISNAEAIALNSNRAPVSNLAEDDTSRLPGVLDFPMAGEDEGLSSIAPSGQMYGMNSPDDPDLISFPTLPVGLLAAGQENIDVEDIDALPTLTDDDNESTMRAGEEIIGLPSMDALTEVTSGAPMTADATLADATLADATLADATLANTQTASAPPASAPPVSQTPTEAPAPTAPVESVFDFGDASSSAAPIDDFESAFADMIGDAPSATPVAAPAVQPSAFAMDPTLAPEQSDFDLDQFVTPASAGDSFGLDDFGFGGDAGTLTPTKVYEVLQPRLQELVAEIRRSLEYFSSRYPDSSVQRIILVGGGARLPNMDAMLTQEIGIPTIVDKPLSRLPIQISGLPTTWVDDQGATFAVATGLALRDVV